MYSLYIGSMCNVAFPMARFTCIVTSQVFVEIWMRWSIALSSAFYTGKKHLWIVFSFNFWLFMRIWTTILHTGIFMKPSSTSFKKHKHEESKFISVMKKHKHEESKFISVMKFISNIHIIFVLINVTFNCHFKKRNICHY